MKQLKLFKKVIQQNFPEMFWLLFWRNYFLSKVNIALNKLNWTAVGGSFIEENDFLSTYTGSVPGRMFVT